MDFLDHTWELLHEFEHLGLVLDALLSEHAFEGDGALTAKLVLRWESLSAILALKDDADQKFQAKSDDRFFLLVVDVYKHG